MDSSSVRFVWRLGRYREIAGVLFKYGFGDLVQRLHLGAPVEFGKRLVRAKGVHVEELTTAARLRLALEELGPTFIKFGQVLSTRPDVVPPEIIDELTKLQENVAPFSSRQARELVALELGKPVEAIFAEFDDKPLAAASIAQVHRARLRDGTPVAVKLRRPSVTGQVERDLDILFHLAHLAEQHLPESDVYDPTGLVKHFARTIRREMDFVREGRTLERFRNLFENDQTFHVPAVHWEWTTPAMLTMEYVEGLRVTDRKALVDAGLDPREIAGRGVRIFLAQALTHGAFHGDPHPGNLRILPKNVVCMLDYGMVGRVSDEMKDLLADLMIGIVRHDVPAVVDLFMSIGQARAPVDRQELANDVADLIDTYYGLSLKQLPVENLVRDFLGILSQYRIRYPSSLMLLARALVTLEGVGRDLDPKFNLAEKLVPFVETLMRQRHNPRRIAGRLASDALKSVEATRRIPLRVNDLLDQIEKEQLQVPFVHRGLERLISELDRSSNRIAVGLVLASSIIASAMIIQDWRNLGLAGFLLSAFLGFWLVLGIFRSGRL